VLIFTVLNLIHRINVLGNQELQTQHKNVNPSDALLCYATERNTRM